MIDASYIASKTRSNRPGWSISFRHPLRLDARGRAGRKIKRGLRTADDAEADRMVAEMNAILADRAWWNASKRREAEMRFSAPVVDAFYDEIQAGREDPRSLRENEIHLPTKDDGYSRVLFVGTTGAGKTSLLRQLIGSDPDSDRFPSTAPAKTTIADIEVIQAEGEFKAAVTFFSEFQVQANVEECVTDACLALFSRAPMAKVAERFLNHRDQKFRLCYILGAWCQDGANDEDEDLSFDERDDVSVDDDAGAVSEDDRAKQQAALENYLDRMSELTRSVAESLARDLDVDVTRLTGQDREAAQQLIEENFESYLYEDETFHALVQDLLDDIKARFAQIQEAQLCRRPSDWPELWRFETSDRDDFIRHIRWFSSNYWPQFGRLLTPLVQGIRIRGPLFSEVDTRHAKLALIDGQGLGHTPDSSASVTTHITQRFADVDVILLVDNAQQPMQAAPLSVLRAVAASGHHDKLAIGFTHFDLIKGTSLPTFAEKRAHVMASVLNALASLRDALGAPVVRVVEHGIEQRCFMLGGLDRSLVKLPPKAAAYMQAQLASLVEFFEKAIEPPPPPAASPEYDPTGIPFAIQEAIQKFQLPWLARLGLGTYEGVRKEHWTRVKALNRRIAGELDVEYDTLQPVADLVARLSESISRFLDKPIGWTRAPADEQEEQNAISTVRRAVSAAIHDLATKRLIEEHLAEWRTAYDGAQFRGTGSTFRRARAIQGIYDAAAPIPDAVMATPTVTFLAEIRRIVTSAIEASGGHVRLEAAV
jgi:predicted GTPase